MKRLAQSQGLQYDKKSPDFPLERTRLRGIYVLSTITVLGIIGYGLTLKFRGVSVDYEPVNPAINICQHIAVMLVMQLLTGTSTAAIFTVSTDSGIRNHCDGFLTRSALRNTLDGPKHEQVGHGSSSQQPGAMPKCRRSCRNITALGRERGSSRVLCHLCLHRIPQHPPYLGAPEVWCCVEKGAASGFLIWVTVLHWIWVRSAGVG